MFVLLGRPWSEHWIPSSLSRDLWPVGHDLYLQTTWSPPAAHDNIYFHLSVYLLFTYLFNKTRRGDFTWRTSEKKKQILNSNDLFPEGNPPKRLCVTQRGRSRCHGEHLIISGFRCLPTRPAPDSHSKFSRLKVRWDSRGTAYRKTSEALNVWWFISEVLMD